MSNSKTNSKLGIVIAIIILLVISILIYSKIKSIDDNKEDLNESTTSSLSTSSNSSQISSAEYIDYDESKLRNAETSNVVLFFKADWCPTCNALDQNIQQNIDTFPQDLILMKVNFDSERDLKIKYGVTIQHTLIQVDKEGNQLKRWGGSPTLSDLVDELI